MKNDTETSESKCCANCKWWQTRISDLLAICHRVEESPEHVHSPEDGFFLILGDPEVNADLVTGRNFGCTRFAAHEGKTTPFDPFDL